MVDFINRAAHKAISKNAVSYHHDAPSACAIALVVAAACSTRVSSYPREALCVPEKAVP